MTNQRDERGLLKSILNGTTEEIEERMEDVSTRPKEEGPKPGFCVECEDQPADIFCETCADGEGLIRLRFEYLTRKTFALSVLWRSIARAVERNTRARNSFARPWISIAPRQSQLQTQRVSKGMRYVWSLNALSHVCPGVDTNNRSLAIHAG